MAINRLNVLKSMLEQDPSNAFARYGLAMELMNSDDNEQAILQFDELLKASPDYVAGYYHAGRTLEKLGRIEEARAMYERGIKKTGEVGDDHTRGELQGALDMLDLS